MIIKIFSDFCDNNSCRDISISLLTQEQKNKQEEENIIIVGNDENNFTHAIILNCDMPYLNNIQKENVIGLAFEPFAFLQLNDKFIEYAKKHIGKYFVGDVNNLPDPFIENQGFLWHLPPPKGLILKNKIMSIIISKKYFSFGHKYRHEIVKNIINNNLPIDIYGTGCELYTEYLLKKKDTRFKGKFNNEEPYENYYYSICIENVASNHYFSEKISSPIMYNCMPIYYGCKNIKTYFEKSYIELNGNIENDMNVIISILRNPTKFYKETRSPDNIKTPNLLLNIDKFFQ
jgi:hypothetical protein